MYLPTFPRRMAAVRHVQTDFRGYDHRPSCPEGGIYEMTNGSAADAPLFSTRPGRTLTYPTAGGNPNGLFAGSSNQSGGYGAAECSFLEAEAGAKIVEAGAAAIRELADKPGVATQSMR